MLGAVAAFNNKNNHFTEVSNLLAKQRHPSQIRSNVGFWGRGENRSTRKKTSRSKVENQQTTPTYEAGSGNLTRGTLVEGERSHHCAIPVPNWV